MSWSPDGELLASGPWDQTVQVWSSGSGTRLFTYRGHTESVNAIAWSPEGTWLASGDLDDQAHVSPADAEEINTLGCEPVGASAHDSSWRICTTGTTEEFVKSVLDHSWFKKNATEMSRIARASLQRCSSGTAFASGPTPWKAP